MPTRVVSIGEMGRNFRRWRKHYVMEKIYLPKTECHEDE
jgi:hypothetical protein